MPRFVYLPIEVKVREFWPKVWLASWLARAGFVCLLGTKRGISESNQVYPPGVLFEKSISARKVDKLRRAARFYESIVCQDEEAGLARSSLDGFLEERVSADTLGLTERYYCWGERDAAALGERYPNEQHKLVTTGAPRLDLWREELVDRVFRDEIASIRQKYGRFLLVNSSFGITSEGSVSGQLDQAIRYGLLAHEKVGEKQESLMRRLSEFRSFLKSVRALAEAMPELNIVCRPHPAEGINDWSNPLSDLANVFVTRDGDVAKWIGACSAVLHEGCTTAVQAGCMKRPAIALIPEDLLITDKVNDLPLRVSRIVRTNRDLIDCVHELTSSCSWSRIAGTEEVLSGRIVDLEGAYCAERIASDLVTVSAGEYPAPSAWKKGVAGARSLRHRFRRGNPSIGEVTAAKNYVMGKEKMPGGVGLSEARAALGRFARLEEWVGELQIDQPFRDVVKVQL